MEASPATRLPEADALPDGFVESSSADQAPLISSAPAAGDSPHPALGPDHEAATVDNGSETLDAPSTSSTAADALRSLDLNVAWEPEEAESSPGQQGAAADIGGDLSLSLSHALTATRSDFCTFNITSSATVQSEWAMGYLSAFANDT